METIWVCKHIFSGSGPQRLTNLDGFVHLDCGRKEHIKDLRHPGVTIPAHLNHFSSDIQEISSSLPICCKANRTDHGWMLESFVDKYCKHSGYCSVAIPAQKKFRKILHKGLHYFVSPQNYPAIVNGAGGLRSVPIWDEKKIANENKGKWFPEDMLVQLTKDRLISLIADMNENQVNFFNYNFGKKDWDEVFLSEEVLKAIENDDSY